MSRAILTFFHSYFPLTHISFNNHTMSCGLYDIKLFACVSKYNDNWSWFSRICSIIDCTVWIKITFPTGNEGSVLMNHKKDVLFDNWYFPITAFHYTDMSIITRSGVNEAWYARDILHNDYLIASVMTGCVSYHISHHISLRHTSVEITWSK